MLDVQEAEIRRSQFKASLGKSFERPYLEKNPTQKRANGVVQGMGPKKKKSGKGKEYFSTFMTSKHLHFCTPILRKVLGDCSTNKEGNKDPDRTAGEKKSIKPLLSPGTIHSWASGPEDSFNQCETDGSSRPG
jgi:hypothetical protein